MDETKLRLISTDDAATRLGVARSTVTRWAQSGTLVPIMQTSGLRGAYIFNEADIDALAASRAS